MEVSSNLSRCCHLISPTCLILAYSHITHNTFYTHAQIIIIIISNMQCSPLRHTKTSTQIYKMPLCRVPAITDTRHFTYRLSVSPFRTYTSFPCIIISVSPAHFSRLPCSPFPPPRCRGLSAWLCPHAQSQMHTIHPSPPHSHPVIPISSLWGK